MKRKILFNKTFIKNFAKRIKPNEKLKRRFNERLVLLQNEPSHPSLRNHALSGDMKGSYAFSLTGDHRVIYEIDDEYIWLINIGTHAQVYE